MMVHLPFNSDGQIGTKKSVRGNRNPSQVIDISKQVEMLLSRQGVLLKGSGNSTCSPLALHCGGKSYLGAQLDKEGGHLAQQVG